MNHSLQFWNSWLLPMGESVLVAAAPPVAGKAAQAAAQAVPAAGTLEPSQPLGTTPGTPQASPNMGSGFLFMMVGMLVLMIVMSVWSGRKEKKRREELLSSIGRYDRVQTAGGILGTVVDMRDDEIVLKVDESTNTRIAFARSAITAVVKRGPGSPHAAPEVAAVKA